MGNADYMQLTIPNYSYVFNFEKTYSYTNSLTWSRSHYPNCFLYCGIYAVIIFGGKHYMSNRPKFNLRSKLALWSAMLALFSIMGFLRTAPEMFHTLRHHGFYYSICSPSYLTQDHVSGFWTFLFILSKIAELGDTIFIVLRKQPLIFLHWYHHITVLLYSWLCYIETTATGRWYTVMNYFVHSWMYSYYALKAMQFSPPKWVAMLITTLQLVQMVAGCAVTAMSHYYVASGRDDCHVQLYNAKLGMLMYISYFILFSIFFKNSYLSGKHTKNVGKKDYANDKLKAN
ncbi:elongation of very long chain fatty acids protein 6-like [Bombus vosnesenskii]|uniref:Elongation of very long chain fatty acids protein n=3 Tax=Pyrobombus TaxID=144703 RepID=A0A6J3KTA5_9HYME|nr:elongation of very long chain fatty acids protein 6-like [Bombus impatiens]XP_033179170.1 elongation of very long chain fatty acids protein 6-like [Bombus impatiens]XP_033320177.1 elongation of very long chain fatty acids protein 6-like [Bombus bifarius]XP_033355331.1 elongation of very long chain fatty acids protein 6-like [Bombus vosnesenskii]XP_050491918.1 elongation of very long chain fatty acids protein 6-like isoform X1 [Bombus huntii]XP_050491919.1 elongation of very long chain fatty